MNPSTHTRRDFLKTSAGMAAAGVAAPYFLTGARAKAEESKNDKFTVAAIGVGGRGSEIGRHAAHYGNMVACADVHLGNADKFAGPFGGKCQVYQDYRKVLDRKDVEAVTIGTPDHWHTKIAIEAMQAGKDVYCEKPLTLTIEEGRLICQVAKETGRVFQVGTQQRSEFGRAFLEAVVIARSGRLGDKLKARASVGNGLLGGPFATEDPPKELDWDFWLGQAPEVPFCPSRIGHTFRWWFDYSGGNVTDWGVHHTDIALWALGGEDTGPVEVEGKGEFPLGRELTLDYLLGKKPVDELPNSYNATPSFDCTMNLPNGNAINLNSVGNDLFIAGEKGHLAVNRGGIRGRFVEELKKNPADKQWLDEEVAKLYRGKPFHGHMANFFDCVKDRSLPVSDVFSHCNSVNACHTANIAMLLGRKVKWDQKKYEFVGDDEANRLTRRKQREPYAIKA
ncbi:MAG: Gfo/Idh/MocA family oxidoreductase [Planctomycetes bacterium]|nr:Gfo/Idh/MocA family oxidoreductase [Planctomycetota bacterium]MBU4397989.1 Gfo/Idh/MocA family oxidoreductase [Planctomycetota bacterium]MCG2684331.1 Gfo/Idh/MocA family oxidoreductase [Planctomycetales bacterium]